jgi:hypothetical protein
VIALQDYLGIQSRKACGKVGQNTAKKKKKEICLAYNNKTIN